MPSLQGCLLSGWKNGSWKVAFAEGAGAGVDVNFGVQQANKGVNGFLIGRLMERLTSKGRS